MEPGSKRGFTNRWIIVVILALLLAYASVGIYFHFILDSGAIYTHFAYIPIVISGIWWGRKAVLVALAFAGVLLLFHAFGSGAVEIWDDVARIIFFIVVALCVGILSEKLHTGRKALRISEEKFRFLVDKSLAGILLYKDEKIEFVNPRFAEMLGYDPSSLKGIQIWDLIFSEDKVRIKELIREREEQGFEDLHYESRLVRKDGGIIWVDVASSVEHYEGDTAVLVNVYDITDRKEAEKKRGELAELARRQEEQLVHSTRLAELGEMAAGVAHELNQPLTGIRNFARNAIFMIEQDAGSTEEVRDNLDLISGQVDRASRIINQMRELVRKSDRKFELVDVNTIVKETVEFLTPQFRLSAVEVNIEAYSGLPQVMADRTRLEQVFLNVLTNARQAMEDSAVRKLHVKTRLDTTSERPVVIVITDTGRGFDQMDVDRIFMPFYSTKEPGSGTGLGLSISLNILKEHDGTIEAEGKSGEGARFTIRLPAGDKAKIHGVIADNDPEQ